MCFLILTGFSGEQCGTWSSCFQILEFLYLVPNCCGMTYCPRLEIFIYLLLYLNALFLSRAFYMTIVEMPFQITLLKLHFEKLRQNMRRRLSGIQGTFTNASVPDVNQWTRTIVKSVGKSDGPNILGTLINNCILLSLFLSISELAIFFIQSETLLIANKFFMHVCMFYAKHSFN